VCERASTRGQLGDEKYVMVMDAPIVPVSQNFFATSVRHA
jgi:hypothetical protein